MATSSCTARRALSAWLTWHEDTCNGSMTEGQSYPGDRSCCLLAASSPPSTGTKVADTISSFSKISSPPHQTPSNFNPFLICQNFISDYTSARFMWLRIPLQSPSQLLSSAFPVSRSSTLRNSNLLNIRMSVKSGWEEKGVFFVCFFAHPGPIIPKFWDHYCLHPADGWC